MSVNRLVGIYATTSPETMEQGRLWYPTAFDSCDRIADSYGVDTTLAIAVVSILSPNSRWEQNLDDAATVIENAAAGRYPDEYTVTTYNRNKAKAHDLVLAYLADVPEGFRRRVNPDFSEYVTGEKVSAFYRAIAGDVDSLVLDSHCINAFVGRRIAGANLGWTPIRTVRACREGFYRAASLSGETVRDFQAIIWLRHIERIQQGKVPGYSRVNRKGE